MPLTEEVLDRGEERYNIYCQPINFPTVDVGTERLRFAPTPFHDDGMIEDLVIALTKLFNTN